MIVPNSNHALRQGPAAASSPPPAPARRLARPRPARSRPPVDPYNSRLWMLAVAACALAIASVPVFSRQAGLSFIPQLMALAAVGMAGVTCFLLGRVPRIHPAVIAYLLLVAMWAFTVPDDPTYRAQYLSLVKLSVLAVAVHLVIRAPRHLLFLLGAYTLSGAVALMLNWNEIREIRYAVESGSAIADRTRFDGTFSNANAAGVFAAFAALCSLIVFYNTRHVVRWVVLASGVTSGLVIGGLTGSRTGMLGLLMAGVSLPVLALAGKREDLLSKWLKGSLFLFVAAGIALATLTQLPQFERLTRLTEGAGADESTYTRWGMAKESVRIWLDYPIAGAGFQGFQRVSWFEGSYSHTTYGEVLANGGAIGFLLLGIFYAWPGMQLVSLARGNPQPGVRRLATALLVYWVVFSASSVVAVLHLSRDLVPLWAGICGWLVDFRKLRYLRAEKSGRY